MTRTYNYPHLTEYLERLNARRKYFQRSLITIPMTDLDIEDVKMELECDLSPENLHCDGEISQALANRKYDRLMRVKGDLELATGRKIELEY